MRDGVSITIQMTVWQAIVCENYGKNLKSFVGMVCKNYFIRFLKDYGHKIMISTEKRFLNGLSRDTDTS